MRCQVELSNKFYVLCMHPFLPIPFHFSLDLLFLSLSFFPLSFFFFSFFLFFWGVGWGVCVIIQGFFFKKGVTILDILDSLCSQGRPQTHGDPPAFASWVLGSKAHGTTAWLHFSFIAGKEHWVPSPGLYISRAAERSGSSKIPDSISSSLFCLPLASLHSSPSYLHTPFMPLKFPFLFIFSPGLATFVSIWHKLELSERREPQLKKMPP